MPEYKYNDNTQLTPHFNIQEFRCKCGQPHTTIIATELPKKLESLYTALRCSKIIINSGYRCYTHDIAVGGTGSGKHVSGDAADIKCYDKNNKIISSKIVCCAAQDVGFGGIANIDTTYTATHVDVRTTNFWKGDESITTAYSLTNNFYDYYKLSEKDVYQDTVKETEDKKDSIDVSVKIGDKTYKGKIYS